MVPMNSVLAAEAQHLNPGTHIQCTGIPELTSRDETSLWHIDLYCLSSGLETWSLNHVSELRCSSVSQL